MLERGRGREREIEEAILMLRGEVMRVCERERERGREKGGGGVRFFGEKEGLGLRVVRGG